jgi:Ca-activated chloride channel family protein
MKIEVSRILRPSIAMACAFFGTFALTGQTSQAPAGTQTPVAPAAQAAPQQSQPTTPAQAAPPQTAPADGQQPPQNGASDDNAQSTFRVTSNEVYLEFVVSDKHGHFIKDLKQNDFALLDDNKAPAQVYSFTQETNLTPDYRQNWTNDMDALTRGIQDLRPGGGTALYDAVYSACRDKLLTSRGQEPVRKAIVLVSDGDDNQSHAYLEDAIKECHRADTIIYAISTNVSPSRGHGDDVLKKMAVSTGGKAFFPTTIEEMPVSFQAIQDELRSQYALVYKPADFKADGAFRPIYLFCLDRRYTVRVREGYFAPKG